MAQCCFDGATSEVAIKVDALTKTAGTNPKKRCIDVDTTDVVSTLGRLTSTK